MRLQARTSKTGLTAGTACWILSSMLESGGVEFAKKRKMRKKNYFMSLKNCVVVVVFCPCHCICCLSPVIVVELVWLGLVVVGVLLGSRAMDLLW